MDDVTSCFDDVLDRLTSPDTHTYGDTSWTKQAHTPDGQG